MVAAMVQQLVDQAQVLGAYSYATISEQFAPGQPAFWMALCPFVAYWLVAGFYEVLDSMDHPGIKRHRVTRKQRLRENPVTHTHVILRVIVQQVLQTLASFVLMLVDPGQCSVPREAGLVQAGLKMIVGIFIMDAWQYWIHRAMHTSTFLYKHFHSIHHQLMIPYASGALYNHPVEALVLDTLGAGVSMLATGMSCQLATVFFTFSTCKTVFDHCNYRFPLNPVFNLFPNDAAYHDVHHDIRGIKMNFSQPFFTLWDVLMGTYLDPKAFHYTKQELDVQLGLTKTQAKLAAAAAPSPASNTAGHDTSSINNNTEEVAAAAASPKRADKPAVAAAAPESPVAEVVVAATPSRGPRARKPAAVQQDVPLTPGVTTRSRARQAGVQ